MLAVPAMSVELFRYRSGAKDGEWRSGCSHHFGPYRSPPDPPEGKYRSSEKRPAAYPRYSTISFLPRTDSDAPGSDQVITNEDSAEGNSATFPSWCANPP